MSSDRQSVGLPMVVRFSSPSAFISRTASTASWLTRRVFAHDSGSVRVLEKTTFDRSVRPSRPGSPVLAMSDIRR